ASPFLVEDTPPGRSAVSLILPWRIRRSTALPRIPSPVWPPFHLAAPESHAARSRLALWPRACSLGLARCIAPLYRFRVACKPCLSDNPGPPPWPNARALRASASPALAVVPSTTRSEQKSCCERRKAP